MGKGYDWGGFLVAEPPEEPPVLPDIPGSGGGGYDWVGFLETGPGGELLSPTGPGGAGSDWGAFLEAEPDEELLWPSSPGGAESDWGGFLSAAFAGEPFTPSSPGSSEGGFDWGGFLYITPAGFVQFSPSVFGRLLFAVENATGAVNLILPPQTGQAGKVLGTDGTTVSWGTMSEFGGTLTNVGLSAPDIFSVTDSPVTGSGGTIALGLVEQNANTVWAGPTTGAAAEPSFRTLVAGDMPDLSATYQPKDADLTAIAALTTDAFGRVLLTKTSQGEVRSYIGAGTSSFSGAYADLTGIPSLEPAIAAGTTAQYWRGDKTWQTLNKTAVGLANVANVDTTNADNISSGRLPNDRNTLGAQLLDGSENLSLDLEARQAFAADGTTKVIDWTGADEGASNAYFSIAAAALGAASNQIWFFSTKVYDEADGGFIINALFGGETETRFGQVSGDSAWGPLDANERITSNSQAVYFDNAGFVGLGSGITALNATQLTSGTVPAARMPAHTGDVTSSAGAVTLTIANNAVTLAKMADMATASFLGRNTAATGDPEVLSIATAKTMLNLTGTNSGDQTITLTGDVTGSGTGSFAATIGAGKVTFAMLATAAWDDDVTLAGDSATKLPTQHAVKSYVDNLTAGLKFKQDCRVASTANVNIASAPALIDGVTLTSGDRALLKNQSAEAENGPYIFNGTGNAMTRATDGDTGTELISATFPIREGTVNADAWWTVTNDSITLGTTAIVFTQTAGAGTYTAGSGLSLTGNSFSVAAGGVTDAMLAGSIAYSKLSLTGAILNADLAGSIAYSKLSLTGAILNADLAGSIAASKLVGTDIATLGTVTAGTWNAAVLVGTYGGTGVNNGAKTITLGDNLTTSGNFALTLTQTATTNVTLPTTGTLATLAGSETFTNKTLTSAVLSGTTSISEQIVLPGDLSPSQITANQNDYNPTGLSTASVLKLNSDISRAITGLAGGADGRLLIVMNTGAADAPRDITLSGESASSSAANRFAASTTVRPGDTVFLLYDAIAARWKSSAHHPHAATDITSGTLSVARGGTGVSNGTGSITLSGNATLADWFDQSVKVAASPTFAGLTSTGNVQVGTTASSGGATPLSLSMGGTFNNTTNGDGSKAKFKFYDDGTNYDGVALESVAAGFTQMAFLSHSGVDHAWYINSVEKMRLKASNGFLKVSSYGAGTLVTDASGNITVSSDERLKDIDGDFERGLDALRKIQPILYRNNKRSGLETEHVYAGFGARNVRKGIPEAVFGTEVLSLQDRPIIAALVNAVKELEERLRACEKSVTQHP